MDQIGTWTWTWWDSDEPERTQWHPGPIIMHHDMMTPCAVFASWTPSESKRRCVLTQSEKTVVKAKQLALLFVCLFVCLVGVRSCQLYV